MPAGLLALPTSLASSAAEDAGRVISRARAVAGVVVSEGPGGGEVSLVGWVGGDGENISSGGGGDMRIW
jgi:hypothetical protein